MFGNILGICGTPSDFILHPCRPGKTHCIALVQGRTKAAPNRDPKILVYSHTLYIWGRLLINGLKHTPGIPRVSYPSPPPEKCFKPRFKPWFHGGYLAARFWDPFQTCLGGLFQAVFHEVGQQDVLS